MAENSALPSQENNNIVINNTMENKNAISIGGLFQKLALFWVVVHVDGMECIN